MVEHAERIRKAVEDHLFDINDRTVQLTVSIGVASITENSPKAEELMARAHTASAEVRKLEGHAEGNGVVVYNPADFETLDQSNSVEAIQKALEDNRFRLLFQPIINLRGEGEEHYEAFVRMLDKDDEEVSPMTSCRRRARATPLSRSTAGLSCRPSSSSPATGHGVTIPACSSM